MLKTNHLSPFRRVWRHGEPQACAKSAGAGGRHISVGARRRYVLYVGTAPVPTDLRGQAFSAKRQHRDSSDSGMIVRASWHMSVFLVTLGTLSWAAWFCIFPFLDAAVDQSRYPSLHPTSSRLPDHTALCASARAGYFVSHRRPHSRFLQRTRSREGGFSTSAEESKRAGRLGRHRCPWWKGHSLRHELCNIGCLG